MIRSYVRCRPTADVQMRWTRDANQPVTVESATAGMASRHKNNKPTAHNGPVPLLTHMTGS